MPARARTRRILAPMAAPTRPAPTLPRRPPSAAERDPRRPGRAARSRWRRRRDHELLTAAVEEAARLLDADGAMVYLVDPATGHLRFAHDAGIGSAAQPRLGPQPSSSPLGTGMFGRAVAERAVVVTDDYRDGPGLPPRRGDRPRRRRHRHPLDGRGAARRGRRGLRGDRHVLHPRRDAFDPAQIALVRALADHAAAAMANARLIEDARPLADRARRARRGRADAARDQRPDLGRRGPARACSSWRSTRRPACCAPTARASTSSTRLRACSAGPTPRARVKPDDDDLAGRPRRDPRPGHLRSGGRQRRGRSGPAITAEDDRFPHGRGRRFVHRGIGHPLGHGRAAGRRAGAVRRADDVHRPHRRLGRGGGRPPRGDRRPGRDRDHPDAPDRGARPSRGALARRAEAERALREIAARITAMRDPAEILQHVVELAEPPRRRAGRDPRPPRPGDRPPALGVRRRPAPAVHRGRSGPTCGSRSGSGRPARPSRRTASSSPATTSPRSSRRARNRPSSTSAPASTR